MSWFRSMSWQAKLAVILVIKVAVLFAIVIAFVLGLSVGTVMGEADAMNRCEGQGGSWSAAERVCERVAPASAGTLSYRCGDGTWLTLAGDQERVAVLSPGATSTYHLARTSSTLYEDGTTSVRLIGDEAAYANRREGITASCVRELPGQ